VENEYFCLLPKNRTFLYEWDPSHLSQYGACHYDQNLHFLSQTVISSLVSYLFSSLLFSLPIFTQKTLQLTHFSPLGTYLTLL